MQECIAGAKTGCKRKRDELEKWEMFGRAVYAAETDVDGGSDSTKT